MTGNANMDVLRRNNLIVSGHGARSIVFSHGFGCDLSTRRDVSPAFEADFRVVLFDHVGAGGSDTLAYQPAKYATLSGYAQDVLDMMTALDLANAVFVGHSVPAIIAMLAASQQPERFASLVMICPSPCYLNDGADRGGFDKADIAGLFDMLDRNFLSWSRATAPAIMGNADRPGLGTALSDSICRMDPEIGRRFARVTFLSDHRADLPKLGTRSLILQTGADMVAPISVGEYVADTLRDGTFVMMQATGHWPHMSAPAETIDAIRHFLAA